MKMPLVSIVTPCYNGESYLDRYFNSILNQTYPNLELIFVNDGSSDNTEKIALSYKDKLEKRGVDFKYIYQKNAGQAAALNNGLKYFKGEYLTWPDSDDEMTPECIEKKVDFLENHQDISMVRSNGIYYDVETDKKRRISDNVNKQPSDIFYDLLLVNTYGCCGCYMIKIKTFLECYPDRNIDESRVGQNWQLLVPVASRTLCGYIDEDLYIVYEHNDSHSRRVRTVNQMYKRLDDFADVLHNAINVSKCDNIKCKRLIDENRFRQQFYYAVSVSDKPMLRKTISGMRKNGSVKFKEWLLFAKHMAARGK